jgi:hypothetical protein
LDMIELTQEGITKPAAIAQRLGVEPEQIYAASKRLDRRVIAVAKRVKGELAGEVVPDRTTRGKIFSLDVIEAIADLFADVELTDDETYAQAA